MSSLANIPDNLKAADQKETFVRWLSQQPIEYSIRRTYAAAWTRLTGVSLPMSDWSILQQTSPKIVH